jgi:hypothetical protein
MYATSLRLTSFIWLKSFYLLPLYCYVDIPDSFTLVHPDSIVQCYSSFCGQLDRILQLEYFKYEKKYRKHFLSD